MPAKSVRRIINRALNEERQYRSLHQLVETRIEQIHHSIDLPTQEATEKLIQFLEDYVVQIPDFLNAVVKAAKATGLYKTLWPALYLTEDFFKQPPSQNQTTGIFHNEGLASILSEAYLAHRLFEEINDQFQIRFGLPIIPVEMTTANLVVHSLIGESYANELDEVVFHSVQLLMEESNLMDSDQFEQQIRKKEKQWRQTSPSHSTPYWQGLVDQDRLSIQLDMQHSHLN